MLAEGDGDGRRVKMRVAVIGANGQIGSDLVEAVKRAGCGVLELTHADVEVTDRGSVDRALADLKPGDAVVNTAAFHRTEDCETDPRRAFEVNVIGAHAVSAAARARDAVVVQLSTDFVFDGSKQAPYVESDAAAPINVYGVTKLGGEVAVREANPAHYIARLSSVFGVAGSSGKGGNFVETMLAKGRAGRPFDVVDDLTMSPTYAADAAELIVALLVRKAPFGNYHLSNAGACTWRDFADAILTAGGYALHPRGISSAAQHTRARRPKNSALTSERLAALGLSVRPWREALDAYLAAKRHA